ncbi:MAG: glycosyltransferase [Armatimonadetes bacterium]|nr:glycosyltransferase [Armatimonadota bacterium]
MSKVSVVIPLYNYEHYVGGCIESALGQTHPDIEVVVVNDGSKDNGAEVARRYPVRVIDQENQGVASAVNRAVAESTGDYVAWLSADDLFLPDKIKRQMALFDKDPTLDCVFSNLRWRAVASEALEYCPLPREEAERRLREDGQVDWDTDFKPCPSEQILGKLLTTTILIYLGTTLIPRRIFDRLGDMDAAYRRSHDYEFAMRLAADGCKFRMLVEPLVVCRAHAGNAPAWKEIRDDENRVRRKFLAKCTLEQFYPGSAEDPKTLAEHVRWLLHHRMLEEAREAYDAHVRDRAPGAWSLELGKALMGAGESARALVEFDKAVAFEPASMMAHYLRGDACRAEGRLGAAVGSYLKGVRRAVANSRSAKPNQ